MDSHQIPKKLGKYDILAVLGKGAMGTVYTGFDPGIERTVAIKTIHTKLLDSAEKDTILARFKREAQAAGQMAHNNIVIIYDYGEDEGVTYIAMEYIKGQTLKEIFDENAKFKKEDIVALTKILLDALSYAHKRGIVHRDIKPDNIILVDNDLHKLKIMDFGIAKVESSDMTQIGTVMGTPSYMSPEQFLGQRVDLRSDLFSVGVILYQLITGEKPFTGQLTTIMHKVLHEDPPLPSALNLLCPKFLDEVIKKAMAKSPDDRYQSAEEFSKALTLPESTTETEKTVIVEPDEETIIINTQDKSVQQSETSYKEIEDTSLPPSTATAQPVQKKKPIGAIAAVVVAATLIMFLSWHFLSKPQQETANIAKPENPINADTSIVQEKLPEPAPTLITTPGYLDISTNPSGSSIYLKSGKLLGVSPTIITLEPGEYDLLLRKKGFYDLSANIEINADEEVPFINLKLAKMVLQ